MARSSSRFPDHFPASSHDSSTGPLSQVSLPFADQGKELAVTRLRTYRNGDSPALVEIWNRSLPDRNVVRPLNVHEFDALVMGKLPFDRLGLIVAEQDGRVVGFAHAGFGPADAEGASHRMDYHLGTTAMLAIDPGANDPEIGPALLLETERYLRRRGAEVFYCGGQHPLNPFYWGLYGGGEFAGVLEAHTAFCRAAVDGGYEPASRTVVLEADLAAPEPREPKLTVLRRSFRVEIEDDALPASWWDSLSVGLFRPTRFQLLDKAGGDPVAEAWTWDIAAGFAIGDGRSRTGLYRLEVAPTHRRRGLGRLLVIECLKHARQQHTDVLSVQTSVENHPALGLYRGLDFDQVDTATLYRLPADLSGRSRTRKKSPNKTALTFYPWFPLPMEDSLLHEEVNSG